MKNSRSLINTIIVITLLLCGANRLQAQGTAFTYQGRLNNGTNPANGSYDLTFGLFTIVSGAGQVGTTQTNTAVAVSNGLFTVALDFGANFPGADRWLEIGVRTNAGGAFTTLAPRQKLTPTPYAIFTSSAGTATTVASNGVNSAAIVDGSIVNADINASAAIADTKLATISTSGKVANSATTANTTPAANSIVQRDASGGFSANTISASFSGNGANLTSLNASQLTFGTVPSAQLGGTYGNAVTFNNAANSFSGNGGGLTNVNAGTLGGLSSASFWKLLGNGGTTAGLNFLGTTDNQPLELKVNNLRALRLEPTAGTPNVIGGYSNNSVAAGMVGATIGGGGAVGFPNRVTDTYGTVAGGLGNAVLKNDSFIGGGIGNTISADRSVVGGGRDNSIATNASNSVISGGWDNLVQTNGAESVIAGGRGNVIQVPFIGEGNTIAAVISGGAANNVAGTNSSVGGGYNNVSIGFCSTIGGGSANNINEQWGTLGSFWPGGFHQYGFGGTIGGGVSNTITGDPSKDRTASYATISGGLRNKIKGYSGSAIGGGSGNAISIGDVDTISGGAGNWMDSTDASTIGGGGGNYIDGYYGEFMQYMSIGGGSGNRISRSEASVISGGKANSIAGSGGVPPFEGSSTISGGSSNAITSKFAAIPGGYSNLVTGNYAFAAGRRAKATNDGAFVWGDSTSADIASTNADSVTMRAAGGYRLFSNSGATLGVFLAAGGNSWATISDRNAKKNFQPVDAAVVLEKLAKVPIERWNYKSEADDAAPHIGPMAQEFKAAFYPGRDDKSISTMEFDGVALAAIQGLNQKLEEQRAENMALKRDLDKLKQLVDILASAKDRP